MLTAISTRDAKVKLRIFFWLGTHTMTLSKLLAGAAMAAVTFAAGASNAALVFVGAWQVDDGPSWLGSPPDGPLAYTGQEAAALLFGGAAGDYSVSTVSNQVADIDFQAWYSIIGFGSLALAQDYDNKYLGQFYGPTSGYSFGDPGAPASAYVEDNATGAQFTNYAFRDDGLAGAIPEPATWVMLIGGFALTGAALRRRRTLVHRLTT